MSSLKPSVDTSFSYKYAFSTYLHTMPKSFLTIASFLLMTISFAQNNTLETPSIDVNAFSDAAHHWYDIHDKTNVINPLPNKPKYKPTEIAAIADNILLFQKNNGGSA